MSLSHKFTRALGLASALAVVVPAWAATDYAQHYSWNGYTLLNESDETNCRAQNPSARAVRACMQSTFEMRRAEAEHYEKKHALQLRATALKERGASDAALEKCKEASPRSIVTESYAACLDSIESSLGRGSDGSFAAAYQAASKGPAESAPEEGETPAQFAVRVCESAKSSQREWQQCLNRTRKEQEARLAANERQPLPDVPRVQHTTQGNATAQAQKYAPVARMLAGVGERLRQAAREHSRVTGSNLDPLFSPVWSSQFIRELSEPRNQLLPPRALVVPSEMPYFAGKVPTYTALLTPSTGADGIPVCLEFKGLVVATLLISPDGVVAPLPWRPTSAKHPEASPCQSFFVDVGAALGFEHVYREDGSRWRKENPTWALPVLRDRVRYGGVVDAVLTMSPDEWITLPPGRRDELIAGVAAVGDVNGSLLIHEWVNAAGDYLAGHQNSTRAVLRKDEIEAQTFEPRSARRDAFRRSLAPDERNLFDTFFDNRGRTDVFYASRALAEEAIERSAAGDTLAGLQLWAALSNAQLSEHVSPNLSLLPPSAAHWSAPTRSVARDLLVCGSYDDTAFLTAEWRARAAAERREIAKPLLPVVACREKVYVREVLRLTQEFSVVYGLAGTGPGRALVLQLRLIAFRTFALADPMQDPSYRMLRGPAKDFTDALRDIFVVTAAARSMIRYALLDTLPGAPVTKVPVADVP